MTNTQQMMINQNHKPTRTHDMNAWTEQTQTMIRSRIRERELEAASERLAAAAIPRSQGSFRRSVGWLLILTGRLVAGESAFGGESAFDASPAARAARSMAA